MNKPLSLVLLAALGDLPYIDKRTGVVQVLSKPSNVDNQTVYTKIPVSTLATSEDCGRADTSAVEMIPDSRYKGLLYFEERGFSLGLRRASSQQYKSDLRLVCWLNTAKINGGVADMNLSAKAMNQIIHLLTAKQIPNSSPFINLTVQMNRVAQTSAEIFAAYDYDDKRTLFLFYPYDYFAIDFSVSFDLGKGCIPDLPVIDGPNC